MFIIFMKKNNLICIYIVDGFKFLVYYFFIEIVNVLEELVYGYIVFGFNFLFWNKFRNVLQEVKDFVEKVVIL